MSEIQAILNRCRKLKSPRDIGSIFRCVTAEVGELAEEVDIELGTSYKTAGSDGVVGEAVDVIVAALDLIAVHNSSITSEELLSMIDKKMLKWELKTMENLVKRASL